MKINFLFSESVTGNQLILMYYWVQGRVAVAAERAATAVLIGSAIYYSWRLWQLLKEGAEGYQAGEANIKKKNIYISKLKLFLQTLNSRKSTMNLLFWSRRRYRVPLLMKMPSYWLTSHVFLSALSAAYFLPCVILPFFWGAGKGN